MEEPFRPFGTSEYSGITVVAATNGPVLYIALGEQHDAVIARLHWIPYLHRSLPCMGSACAWCAYPRVDKAYLPVLQTQVLLNRESLKRHRLEGLPSMLGPQTTARQKVLEIPPSGLPLVCRLHRGLCFTVFRGAGKLAKKVSFAVFENEIAPNCPVFNVRPYLLKTWGSVNKATQN